MDLADGPQQGDFSPPADARSSFDVPNRWNRWRNGPSGPTLHVRRERSTRGHRLRHSLRQANEETSPRCELYPPRPHRVKVRSLLTTAYARPV